MANSNFSSLLAPTEISIQTLTQYIDGQLNQIANNFYANASQISIGNSSLATIITSENVTTQSLIVGGSTSNVTVNSTAIHLDSYGGTNTYIDAYQAQFSGIISALRGISISGSILDSNNIQGNAGDVLVAGYPGVFWKSSANNANNLGGIAANQYAYANTFLEYQTLADLAANVITVTANNTLFVGNISASQVVSSQELSANLINYQTTFGLPGNVVTLTANNTLYVGEVDASNVVSNAQLVANLAFYQVNSLLAANVAQLTANDSLYLGGTIAANYATKYTNNTITGVYAFNSNVFTYSTLTSNVIVSNTISVNNFVVNTVTITGQVFANSFQGSNGLVLTSNGTGTYWSDVTNYSGGLFDGGTPYSSYVDQPRLDAGGVY
jgi:hypothetical protein